MLPFREVRQLDLRAKELDEEAVTQIEKERDRVRQQVRNLESDRKIICNAQTCEG